MVGIAAFEENSSNKKEIIVYFVELFFESNKFIS
jgi:hypothetical protein